MPAAARKKKATPLMEIVKTTVKNSSSPKKEDKKNEAIVERLQQLLSKSLDEMLEHFDELSLTKKCEIVRDYLPYITPKMAQTDVNTNAVADPLSSQLGKLAHCIQPDEE